MKTKIKLALISIVMFFSMATVLPAYADTPPANLSPDYLFDVKNLDPVEKNLMVQIFGGEFVGEEGSTAISKVMGYLNWVAFCFGVIIISYVLLTSVVNTATSGQLLGKNWSTVWLPLRTS
ncbi:hypothetical protein, partial [Klebsiella pneumoniae]|uniref:hypothetical protein n=1 Tax=Klebsiella pneumoniae TaxID=573 RepID=UPI0032DB32B0